MKFNRQIPGFSINIVHNKHTFHQQPFELIWCWQRHVASRTHLADGVLPGCHSSPPQYCLFFSWCWSRFRFAWFCRLLRGWRPLILKSSNESVIIDRNPDLLNGPPATSPSNWMNVYCQKGWESVKIGYEGQKRWLDSLEGAEGDVRIGEKYHMPVVEILGVQQTGYFHLAQCEVNKLLQWGVQKEYWPCTPVNCGIPSRIW